MQSSMRRVREIPGAGEAAPLVWWHAAGAAKKAPAPKRRRHLGAACVRFACVRASLSPPAYADAPAWDRQTGTVGMMTWRWNNWGVEKRGGQEGVPYSLRRPPTDSTPDPAPRACDASLARDDWLRMGDCMHALTPAAEHSLATSALVLL